MRSLISAALFSVAVAVASCSATHAQQVASDAEIAAARRDLAAAKLESQLYIQNEYDCARRELNAAIRVADEEVRTMRRNLKSFGPFNPFAYGQLPAFHYRNARLCLAEAEARRRLLIDERSNLVRTKGTEFALMQLNVEAARARLVELSGGGVIELDVVKDNAALSPAASLR
ncbi:MAG: hypothetical protein AB7G28_10785 [Pirellulales bacterium]